MISISINNSKKKTRRRIRISPGPTPVLEKRKGIEGNLEVAMNEIIDHGGETSKLEGITIEFIL